MEMKEKEKEELIANDKLLRDVDDELTLKNIQRRREALIAYQKEQKYYRDKAYSCFGKNSIASIPTSPKYSIGKDQRKSLDFNPMTPGPMYSQDEYAHLKYHNTPRWVIGTSRRPPLSSCEQFEYFNNKYEKKDDFGVMMKKWKKTSGGSIALERRMNLDVIEKTPGPGRYDPNFNPVLRKSPTCILGLKLKNDILINSTGTGANVSPMTYNQDNIDKLARYHKFPLYSFQQSKRNDPGFKVWTKHETYWNYSSLGSQIMSHKSTSSLKSFGSETRDDRNKCGVLKAMMQNVPASIRIPMPKI